VYLTRSKKLTGSQLSPPHGKLQCSRHLADVAKPGVHRDVLLCIRPSRYYNYHNYVQIHD